jgi:hypothetical protein
MTEETLAILVGGGPAPWINGVIVSATIEAGNSGLRTTIVENLMEDRASDDFTEPRLSARPRAGSVNAERTVVDAA